MIIAESKGKPVGFGLSLPDFNQILRGEQARMADSRRSLRMLFLKKRIDYARIVILGVLPEYLNSGIGGAPLLRDRTGDAPQNGIPTARRAGCWKTTS